MSQWHYCSILWCAIHSTPCHVMSLLVVLLDSTALPPQLTDDGGKGLRICSLWNQTDEGTIILYQDIRSSETCSQSLTHMARVSESRPVLSNLMKQTNMYVLISESDQHIKSYKATWKFRGVFQRSPWHPQSCFHCHPENKYQPDSRRS